MSILERQPSEASSDGFGDNHPIGPVKRQRNACSTMKNAVGAIGKAVDNIEMVGHYDHAPAYHHRRRSMYGLLHSVYRGLQGKRKKKVETSCVAAAACCAMPQEARCWGAGAWAAHGAGTATEFGGLRMSIVDQARAIPFPPPGNSIDPTTILTGGPTERKSDQLSLDRRTYTMWAGWCLPRPAALLISTLPRQSRTVTASLR